MGGFAALAFLSRALRGVARFARSPLALLSHRRKPVPTGAMGPGFRRDDERWRPGQCEASRAGLAGPCLVRSRWSWRQWSCGGFAAEAP